MPKMTRGKDGWYTSIGGRTKWVASFAAAPSVKDAHAAWERRYPGFADAPTTLDTVTLAYACTSLLNAKKAEVGRLQVIEWTHVLKHFREAVGANRQLHSFAPADFTEYMGKLSHLGVYKRRTYVVLIRAAFKWWAAAEWCKVPNFGPVFKQPGMREIRLHRATVGPRMFTAAEVRAMIDRAEPVMKACILLGINGALGPSDINRLRANQLVGGVLNCPRLKTGAARTIPLWPETLAAIDAAGGLPLKTKATIHDRGVFATFNAFAAGAGAQSIGFYSLRRTFRTIAEGAKEPVATMLIMGHAPASHDMGHVYRQAVDMASLVSVSSHVRAWMLTEVTAV